MSALGIGIGVSNILCAVVGLVLALPLLRGRVKMNPLYGVRYKRSFESDELWYAINRYGARRMIVWSIVLGIVGIVTPFVVVAGREALAVLLALAPGLFYGIACLESSRYARRV